MMSPRERSGGLWTTCCFLIPFPQGAGRRPPDCAVPCRRRALQACASRGGEAPLAPRALSLEAEPHHTGPHASDVYGPG